MLSDDILLTLFCHYLNASPGFWPTLVGVCQRWQHIICSFPQGLNLRFYCTYGTPVLKTLDFWPAVKLPIVVQYGGIPNLNPPAPKEYDNIVAALKQSGRVISLSLTITSALLEKVSAISEPFSELEELSLLSQDSTLATLPSTFRWGPRLRTLHSTRIAFPSFPQLLSTSRDLVYLRLHEIPSAGYISPEAFANALSGMTQLRKLSLHFLSLPPRRTYLRLPPQSGERVVLPSLTCFKYRGTSKYLDNLMARIDAPRLGNIDITLFFQPTMDASELGQFIGRTEMLTSLSEANVETTLDAIFISLTDSRTSTPLQIQIACEQLDWQLSSMAQVCERFSPFLFRVNTLSIRTIRSSIEQGDVDGEQWLELIRSFGGARDFRVGEGLETDILCALGQADATVLPSLRNLYVDNPTLKEPSWGALLSFTTSRFFSSYPIQTNVALIRCSICNIHFTRRQGQKNYFFYTHHVNDACRTMCTYCAHRNPGPGHKIGGSQRRFWTYLDRSQCRFCSVSNLCFCPEIGENRRKALITPITPFVGLRSRS